MSEVINFTPETVAVFKHIGSASLYDHVFIQHNNEEGEYVWAYQCDDFEALVQFAVNAGRDVFTSLDVDPADEVHYFNSLVD